MTEAAAQTRKLRDPRVDFWRGVAMIIIFMAHMPGNWWNAYIPAKYGPSDATEMFVFCSGFASAAAFGALFLRSGFWIGTARILLRCWQIYWAHIGLFLALIVICFLGNLWGDGTDYLAKLNLYPFVNAPDIGLFHLMTLTYVPNYFDIMPMYLGVLLMLPLVMILHHRGGIVAAGGFVIAVWLAAQIFSINLPAEWWSDRVWFFNPFGWCLVFFTGFAISLGWIRVPRPNRSAVVVCVLFVLVMIPMGRWQIWIDDPVLKELRTVTLAVAFEKTDFGIARYLHFLALAYLAHCALLSRQHWLRVSWLKPVMMLGQNALPVFLVSMCLSWIGGIVLDVIGQTHVTVAAVNVTGIGLLIVVAGISAFYKRKPWERKAQSALAAPMAGSGQSGRVTRSNGDAVAERI